MSHKQRKVTVTTIITTEHQFSDNKPESVILVRAKSEHQNLIDTDTEHWSYSKEVLVKIGASFTPDEF